MGGPQIVEHLRKSLTQTIYDTKWVPGTAKFVALGSYARGSGTLQVYELDGASLRVVAEAEKPHPLKCGTFGASGRCEGALATGDFKGQLAAWDVERPSAALFATQAHAGVINGLDGFGGRREGCGAPEVATGGSDGAARVWDPRQPHEAVAQFAGAGSTPAECWCVALGDAHSDAERCLLAGYSDGAIRMFDLRTNSLRWEGAVPTGVCGIQFDRRDIAMNKFTAACMDSWLHVYDARTQHPKLGFERWSKQLPVGATVWAAQHLPQDREACMVAAGDGSLALYKYSYPDHRSTLDAEAAMRKGQPGTMKLLCSQAVSTQPVNSFDWSPDKAGLFVCAAFDQSIRVGLVPAILEHLR